MVVAIVVLAGHPETSYKVLLLRRRLRARWPVACVGRRADARGRTPAGRALRALARISRRLPLLGLLLASIQVVPFAEYLRQSFSLGDAPRGPGQRLPGAAATLVTAVVPNFFGNPSHRSYVPMRNAYGWVSNFCEQQLYPGMVTWVLAAVGLVRWRRTWRVVVLCRAPVSPVRC